MDAFIHVTNFLWKWKKPKPRGLPDNALLTDDKKLGVIAFQTAGISLDRAKGSYGSKVYLLPAGWRFVFVMNVLDAQVQNGGFHQFFTNSRGIFDPHLREDIAMIPDDRMRAIISRAFDLYTKMDYRDQWKNLGKSWDYFSAPYKEGRFKTEDTEYYDLKLSIDSLVGSRVRTHWDDYKAV